MTKERNRFVDIMRGVAMLLVVLGHTMTGSTENSENTFIFGIVWSLQMPLFILISGYVTRYSREIVSLKDLFKFFLKRTTAYLLPFAVW
ncbi:MAG: acyltransferase family protein, partial [Clostridia bacterium]|nr:acyltransferase family protein [Clostridia bacterium]